MKISKQVRQSVQFTFIGALPFIGALVLLPFYSNLLSTADFGLLNVYITISLLFQALTSFGVEHYIPVLLHDPKKSSSERLRYYSNALGLQLFAGLGIIGLTFLLGDLLFQWLYPEATLRFWPYGIMSIATGFFNGYFRTETTYYTNIPDTRRYSFFNLFNFVFTVALSILFLEIWKGEIFGPLLGRLISGLLIFLLSLSAQRRGYFPSFSTVSSREIIHISGVMLGYTSLMWVLNYIDRFVITGYCSLETVAVYDFASKCLLPVEFLMMGLSGFILPRIYKSWNGNFDAPPMDKTKTLLHAFLVAAVGGVLLCMIGIPLVAPLVIYNDTLFASFSWIGIMGVSYFTRALFSLYMGLLMLRKEQGRLVATLFYSAVVQMILLFVLVPSYDMAGAVAAITGGKTASLIFMYLDLRGRIFLRVNYRKLITFPLIVAVILLAAFLLEHSFGYYVVSLAATFLSVLVTLFFFRKDLRKAAGLIFSKDV